MRRIFIISFLLLLLNCFSTSAQNDSLKIDSLKQVLQTQKDDTNKVNTLNEFAIAFSQNSDDLKSRQTATEALALSEKINFKKGQAAAYSNIGNSYVFSADHNFSEALKNFNAALKIRIQIDDKRGISESYDGISGIYILQGNYSESLKNMYASLKILEEIKDKWAIGNTLQNIGATFLPLGNDSEALKNFTAALKIREEIGDKSGYAISSYCIADIDFDRGNYDEALKKDSAAFKMCEKLNDKQLLGAVYLRFGTFYEKQGDLNYASDNKVTSVQQFNEALNNYFKSLKIFQEVDNKIDIAKEYNQIGYIYIKLKNYVASEAYLKKGLLLAEIVSDKTSIRDSYLSLSILDSIHGDFQQAYQNHKLYITYRDSLNNEETSRKSESYKMQYELEKERAVAQAEELKKTAEAKRIRNLQYSAIVFFVLIAIFLYVNNRQKQKAKIKIEKAYSNLKSTQAQLIQSEKMASLGELTAGIAHEIQNPLNFVNNFSEVNTELIDELEEEAGKGNIEEVKVIAKDLRDNEQKILHHGKRADAIVKGMLQHSRVSTGHKEPVDINALADEYLRLSYHGMRAKDKNFNAEMKTDFDESIGKINVIPQDIGRVLLNLFNNAFYAVSEKKRIAGDRYEPTVSVCTKRIDNRVEIQIKDNGVGIPQKVVDKIFQPFFTTKPTGSGTGLGLSLSYDIIKAHGGDIRVETREGEGSEFIIQLPL
jgi:two-component system NtrC family sensor kinase